MTRIGIRRMPRIVAAALATAAMIIYGMTAAPAANAADANLGVSTGTGAKASTTVTLDQAAIKDAALQAIAKWRNDAYNDSTLTVKSTDGNGQTKTMTWKQVVDLGGADAKAEYLSPKWSNALERIAIQRVAEAKFNHSATRLDGTSFETAKYQGTGSGLESIGWREANSAPVTITDVIDYWASQKDAFKRDAASSNIEDLLLKNDALQKYGNYLFLITGSNHYGFASDGNETFTGETNTLDGNVDTSVTGLKGTYTVPITVGKAWDANPKVNIGAVTTGRSVPVRVVSSKSDAITYDATWTSSNPAVASVSGNTVTGVAEGSATLTGTLTDGRTVKVPVTVTRFTDVNAGSPHADDVLWLADQGITKGYDDGTFGGMRDVVRQDMAAFLYRLAGSPAFDETKAPNPFRDVDPGSAHYKEILWLAQTGITKGYDDGTFGGMLTVVRQDMAAFLHRYALNVAHKTGGAGAGASFPDVNPGTPHADDIIWLAGNGITKGYGDGTFGGMRTVVRQDMAAFLHRMSANVLAK